MRSQTARTCSSVACACITTSMSGSPAWNESISVAQENELKQRKKPGRGRKERKKAAESRNSRPGKRGLERRTGKTRMKCTLHRDVLCNIKPSRRIPHAITKAVSHVVPCPQRVGDGAPGHRLSDGSRAAPASAPPIRTVTYQLAHFRMDDDTHLADERGRTVHGSASRRYYSRLRGAAAKLARGPGVAGRREARAWDFSATCGDWFANRGYRVGRSYSRRGGRSRDRGLIWRRGAESNCR